MNDELLETHLSNVCSVEQNLIELICQPDFSKNFQIGGNAYLLLLSSPSQVLNIKLSFHQKVSKQQVLPMWNKQLVQLFSHVDPKFPYFSLSRMGVFLNCCRKGVFLNYRQKGILLNCCQNGVF